MCQKGVLVATDQNTEWLLPWWWGRYSASNSFPVAFVDFGMSEEKKLWCKERGTLIPLEKVPVEKQVPQELYTEWQQVYGMSYANSRKAWFKKPLACTLSPFEKTIWLDLDCEVLDHIGSLFDLLKEGKEIAVAAGSLAYIPKGLEKAVEADCVCCSGVIVFCKESLIIQKWAERAFSESDQHWGDDSLLSVIISESPEVVEELSKIYNWRVSREGLPLSAKIIHWCGEWGKECIAKHGGLKLALDRIRFGVEK